MCATVCSSGALTYAPKSEIARMRRERPVDAFVFAGQPVRTLVKYRVPESVGAVEVDVATLCGEPEEVGVA